MISSKRKPAGLLSGGSSGQRVLCDAERYRSIFVTSGTARNASDTFSQSLARPRLRTFIIAILV